jgi:hypothetical protein
MRASRFRLLRERFGNEILFHMEFMKNGDGGDSRRDSAGATSPPKSD